MALHTVVANWDLIWLQTDHLKKADPGLAAVVEKAQSGRGAGEAGEGGLLPEGLIAAEAENPPAMDPANVGVSCA